MKEHVQDYGVRKWAGDDLIELQAEPLSALQALVAPYAPCILQGCELETIPDGDGDGSPAYRLHAGYVALKGRKTVDNGAGTDTEGADTGAGSTGDEADAGVAATAENGDTAAAQDEEYVKIVRVTAQTVKQPTVFLALACTPLSRAYGNGENKAIAYDYTAEVCDVLSEVGDRPYLTLVADNSKNPRLPDMLGITRKLDRVGGEAKDTVVGFTLPSVRLPLFSGLKLGTLFGQIQRWLKDLRALAFKDKVALTDLDADVKKELDGKVAQEDGKGLSQANFTTEEKLKLEGIKDNANNYVHPTLNHIPTGGSSGQYLKYYSSGTAQWVSPDANRASDTADGFMSKDDKKKLNGIAAGATKVIVDSSLNSLSTNPVQNKAVCTALAGKSDSGHVHSWDSVTDKPSSFKPESHSHSWDSITGRPSYFKPESHTHTPSSIGAPKIIAMAKVSSSGAVTNLYGTVTCAKQGTGMYIIRNVTQNNILIVNKYYSGLVMREYLSDSGGQLIFYNDSNVKTDSGFTIMILGL